jgi:hypothetical protein
MADWARSDTHLLGRHHTRVSWLLLGAALAWTVVWAAVIAPWLLDQSQYWLDAFAFTPVLILMGLASSRARKGVRLIPAGGKGRSWAWTTTVIASLLLILALLYSLLIVLVATDSHSP